MQLLLRWPLLVFLLALAVAPALLPEFYVTLLNYIGLYALVALGLVLLTGVGGLTCSRETFSGASCIRKIFEYEVR